MLRFYTVDFSRAEAQFDKIIALDPYRLNDIDILSNILYVAENRTKLSKLTHHYLAIDKDRPEVCCMVGKGTFRIESSTWRLNWIEQN